MMLTLQRVATVAFLSPLVWFSFSLTAPAQDVLQFRSRALTYTMKQAIKRLLPGTVYVSLRDALLGWLRAK